MNRIETIKPCLWCKDKKMNKIRPSHNKFHLSKKIIKIMTNREVSKLGEISNLILKELIKEKKFKRILLQFKNKMNE